MKCTLVFITVLFTCVAFSYAGHKAGHPKQKHLMRDFLSTLFKKFRLADKDHNNVVTKGELTESEAPQMVKEKFGEMDHNKDGHVALSELLTAVGSQIVDQNKDGFISVGELKAAIDLKLQMHHAQKADLNGDKKIDIHEFVKFFTKKLSKPM